MLSKTVSVMLFFSFVCGLFTGNFENMSNSFAVSLKDAVSLCISLVGMMCFWSGFMNVLEKSGILRYVSILLRPLVRLIYGKGSDVNENIDNITASITANFLGLGNASLPLGIKAVRNFDKNNKKGVASDSTIMFCVLATVPFQLLPSTLIAMRTSYGSNNPFDVVPYIWICSVIITIFAIVLCKVFSKIWKR